MAKYVHRLHAGKANAPIVVAEEVQHRMTFLNQDVKIGSWVITAPHNKRAVLQAEDFKRDYVPVVEHEETPQEEAEKIAVRLDRGTWDTLHAAIYSELSRLQQTSFVYPALIREAEIIKATLRMAGNEIIDACREEEGNQ